MEQKVFAKEQMVSIKNWENIVISPNDSIKTALSVIDKEALRLAIVAKNGVLKGVVTDGDIRRAILKGTELSCIVEEIMNRNPITACTSLSSNELQKMMKENEILSLPIVDDEGRVVGLKTLYDTFLVEKRNNPVFIMAGGFGTRLRPLTDNCPKPMLKVGDKPILEVTIQSFIKAGFSNFYISTHYMPEIIEQYFGDGSSLGVNITYVHESEPLGTGGALGLLPKNLPENLPVVMINGDILTNVDYERLLDFHETNDADATMCVREYDYQIPYGVVKGNGMKVSGIEEKPTQRYFINAGIYVISQKIVSLVPKNYHVDMPSLLEMYFNGDGRVLMFPIHEYWLDIGRMDDFRRAQSDIQTLGLD
ncbi:nucleotidyltransferase family protein [Pseudoalteromonas sp. MMG022]|uniref:nucleotidyltransferase family protein n=1 Tax=Pseudoalteromonas sp. MMG022 TaxID=2909978 RepID=UPI001F16E006|nr:nucleotidyltransferase family protein [Pseudoalteromonas sp. MMG022]MCF6434972.1 nucleotidyltransferase family protein [Pseudoalteromonas sp. MMG022]